ncbi:MAG: hypothetical protein AAB152_10960 [Candidatus Coatesbacteria bacterium]
MTTTPQNPPVEIGPCLPAELDQVARLERLWADDSFAPCSLVRTRTASASSSSPPSTGTSNR